MRRTTTGTVAQNTVDKKFAGGDRYVGSWHNGLVRLPTGCCLGVEQLQAPTHIDASAHLDVSAAACMHSECW